MKNILTTTLVICVLSCRAQSPIVPIDASRFYSSEGTYFKDLNNELDKFVGTWKFTGNNSEFILVLAKIEQVEINNRYRDYLRGDYSYVENGIEIVSTLPLSLNNTSAIGGSTIVDDNNFLSCDDCTPNERRIKLYFTDPARDYLNLNMVIRYMQGSSPEQMQVTIYERDSSIKPTEDSPDSPRVPLGSYLMVKQ